MRYGFRHIGTENIYYDGVNLSEHFDITDAAIQLIPSVEIASTKIPGRPGSHFGSVELGERTIRLTMSMHGFDRNKIHISQFWREFVPLLLKDEPRPMQLDESKEIYVILSGIADLNRLGTRGVADVTFTACDPYFYGATKTIEIEAGDNELYVDGYYSVWPTFEITGATNPLVITNNDTADRVYVSETVKPESRVIVDCENERCSINGSYLAVDPRYNDFFPLDPGPVNLKLSSGSGTVSFRERSL